MSIDRSISDTVKPPAGDGEAPVHRLNLNLLYPLDAILHAPTLTEAGRRMRLSQSAMSHALRRLREHFGDDIVTHAGGDQQMTPLGMALRGEVRRVQRDVDATFNFTLSFDPLTTTGTITIAASDVVEQMLLGPVVRHVLKTAPGLGVTIIPVGSEGPQRAIDRGAELPLSSANAAVPGLATLPILTDHIACLIWNGHPLLGDRYAIDEADYRAARHVAARDDGMIALASDPRSTDMLRARRIAVRTSSQATLPGILIDSDLIATGSSWLFQNSARSMPLKVVSAPFPEESTVIVAQWAPHRRRDPMLAWFVEQIEAYVSTFPAALNGR